MTTTAHPGASFGAARETEPVLAIEELVVEFRGRHGTVRAVDGVTLEVQRGSTLGLVGESGSGKTVTALSVLRLLDEEARIVSGRIRFAGKDLVALRDREMRAIRGAKIAMIFQEPTTALNPVFTVGFQVAEAIRMHRAVDRRTARREAIEMLRLVEIPEPESRARSYPHELSGGMCQRVMIAIALACRPTLLLADEPTTALDVTIQAQILHLLRDLKNRLGMSLVLITHDLGVVANEADEVAVMYAGRVVERAPTAELFRAPAHPYTAALLASMPRLRHRSERLVAIPGVVPDLAHLPAGCRFRDRCASASELCAREDPPLLGLSARRSVACHHPVDGSREVPR